MKESKRKKHKQKKKGVKEKGIKNGEKIDTDLYSSLFEEREKLKCWTYARFEHLQREREKKDS